MLCIESFSTPYHIIGTVDYSTLLRFRQVSSCELWYAFKERAARILTLLLPPNGHGQQRAIEKKQRFP